MGQYHRIYNLTKRETFRPSKLGNGPKLLEWASGGAYVAGLAILLANSNGRGGGDLNVHEQPVRLPSGKLMYDADGMVATFLTPEQAAHKAAIALVAGRWAGDRIVVQGDYAEKGDAAFISAKRLASFTDISDMVRDALSADAYLSSLMKIEE